MADMVERVTQVVVSPARSEYERHRDLYPALLAELENRGFEATLEEPANQRGGFELASAEVVVYVAGVLSAVAIDVLAAAIWDGLKAAAKHRGAHSVLDPEDSGRRRATILDGQGRVLKEVVLDDEEPP